MTSTFRTIGYHLISNMLLVVFSLWSFGVASQQLPDRVTLADTYFRNLEYARAAAVYSGLNSPKENLNYVRRLAECYRLLHNYSQAEIWFAQQLRLEPSAGLARFYYAEALQENGKRAEAKAAYMQFMPTEPAFLQLKTLRLAACRIADSLQLPDPAFTIRNERALNSPYSDFGASIHGNNLVFVSDRPVSVAQLKANPAYRRAYGWTNKPYWKLYETNFDSVGGVLRPGLLGTTINSPFNNGPAAFNPTGSVIYFSKAEVLTTGHRVSFKAHLPGVPINHNGIYYAEKANGTWTAPRPLPVNDLLRYSVSHPAVSPDGKTLLFASDMPGGRGGVDLYSVPILADGSFGSPHNLGDSINTAGDEEFPTFESDSSLYFSSTGWPGLGGLDIFHSICIRGIWSAARNPGAPVNSIKDDFSLIFRPGMIRRGYFSSNREGGLGDDDIYFFDYNPVISPPPVAADLAAAKARDTLRRYFKIDRLTSLAGLTLTIPAIHYAPGKADLDTAAQVIVRHVADLLVLYPAMYVEVRSFTDITGSHAGNMLLSRRRAAAIRTFLLAKGITASRVRALGYGDTRPLVRCTRGKPCSTGQNMLNRRTELKILKA